MGKQNFLSSWLCKLGADRATLNSTHTSLDAAYKEAQSRAVDFDLEQGRYIMFSDHHRGAKNRADDFRNCEPIYCAALAYYFELGYSLCVLGDAEEMWEERPARVLAKNDESFKAERLFHEAGRYFRLFGNHDDEWSDPEKVKHQLQKKYGHKRLHVHEAIILRVLAGAEQFGEIVLVHGHQGTQNEGHQKWLPKMALRYGWRPLQQLTGFSCNTPAEDWELREDQDNFIYDWVSKRPKTALIAGHSHAPVFTSRSHKLRLIEDIYDIKAKLQSGAKHAAEKIRELRMDAAKLSAELEWLEHKMTPAERKKWEHDKKRWEQGYTIKDTKPCYFNTGCCSFSDNKITGIEIADGSIRLVRWPDDAGKPNPVVLRKETLRNVFGKL